LESNRDKSLVAGKLGICYDQMNCTATRGNLDLQVDVPKPHWQEGFFDHVLRSSESYSQKWDYVRQNPVRAKLIEKSEDWPWQGECVPIFY